MDEQRFDAALRALHAGTTRRRGVAAAIGVLLGGAGLGAAVTGKGRNEQVDESADGDRTADQHRAAEVTGHAENVTNSPRRQPETAGALGNRKLGKPAIRRPVAEGPCGDGSARDNRCSKNGDCCTKYCPDGACRCKPNWMTCGKNDHCCSGDCLEGRCDGGAKPAGGLCEENFNCQDGLACIKGVCTKSNTAKCTKQNCSGCCEGTVCRVGVSKSACGSGGGTCARCAGSTPCRAGSCGAAPTATPRPPTRTPTPTATATATAVPSWSNQTTFGTSGSDPSELDYPSSVFVSTDGLTAWVADYNNHRISVWTRPNTTTSATAWTNQTTFGTEGTGPNEFEFPVGVFASVDGLTLWVAEYNNSRISVWTRPNTTTDATNWTNQTTFGTDGDGPSNLANPNNVFVSADGLTAWVADYGNNRISVWTRPNTTTSATSWTNQTTFGSTGSGPSEFDYPAGVVASTDGLTVWVADLDNNRISVWTRPNTTTGATNWTNQTTFGTEGSGPGEFDDPSAVFVSADGLTAWVTELLNNRVSVWKRPNTTTDATAWTNQTTFGGDGSSPSQFYDPSGIFVSANGLTAWVADLDNNRISVWTLS